MYNWPHQNTLPLPPPQLSVEATNSHTKIHKHTHKQQKQNTEKNQMVHDPLSVLRA